MTFPSPPRYLFSCLFGLLLALVTLTSHAFWDQTLIDACNAVSTGKASETQKALVVYRNKEINQMALRGDISDSVYQAAQQQFNDVNNPLIQDAAKAGGLKAKLQASSNEKYNAGTDTDVLVESGRSGRKISLDQIKATEKAYQDGLRQYLRERGIKPPAGKINTDTDFMPTRSSVTDAEFTRINKHINANGGTAYERPGAAEVEFQMRLSKNDPGRMLSLRDTGEYVGEMRRLAASKLAHASEWEAEAGRLMASDPSRAEALLADAQLARSQGGKYLQRIDKVTGTLAEQNGVPVPKNPNAVPGRTLSGDSLDSAIRNIGDKGRGVQTAGDAAMVGELGELGIGKGLRHYTETLARMAASKPSKLGEIQAIIAEQAGTLSPTMREALILRAAEAYQNAGGTPAGSRSFGRALVKLVENPPARTRPGAASAGAGGGLPGSVAAGARVAGGVGAVLTVATVLLDFQACVDSGKSEAQCKSELANTLSMTAVVGGGLFISGNALLASGLVSAGTVAAVGSAFAIAGVPLALYAGYSAGMNWAEAPLTKAEEFARNQQKEVLMGYRRRAGAVQAEIDALSTTRAQAATLCQQIINRGKSARKLARASEDAARQWSSALGASAPGGDDCEAQRETVQKLAALARQTRENEDKAIKGLDTATELVEKCAGQKDAEIILRLLEDGRNIGARMLVDAAQARGLNNKLAGADDPGLKRRLAASEESREKLIASNAHLADMNRDIQSLQDEMNALFETYATRRTPALEHANALSSVLPRQAPSPLYEQEYLEANAREAKLRNTLGALPESLICQFGEFGPAHAVTLKLQADNRLNELDERHVALRDQSASCPGVSRQDKLMDDMDASANWVLAAVRMNEGHSERIAACRTKSGSTAGTGSPAPTKPKVEKPWVYATFKRPVYMYRFKKETKDVSLMLARSLFDKDGGGLYLIPDGSGGVYHEDCEVSGPYSGEEAICGVLRGYGKKSVSYIGGESFVECPKDGPTTQPTLIGGGAASAGQGGRPAPSGTGGQLQVGPVKGPVQVISPTGISQPVNSQTLLAPGSSLHTGNGGEISFKSPGGTTVTVGQNTKVRMSPPEAGGRRQGVELVEGSVDVNHPDGTPNFDDIKISTNHGTAVGDGTRYRVEKDSSGTRVQVFEGSVRLTGEYIIRTYAQGVEHGKPSPVKEMRLVAGQQALMTGGANKPSTLPSWMAPGQKPPSQSPLSLPDPWNNPRVQQLIDQWISQAVPQSSTPGVVMHYNEWLQPLSQAARSTSPPDHPADWTRYRYAWENRMRYGSGNLCTLGEFLELSLSGKSTSGCARGTGGTASVPSWMLRPNVPTPSASPVKPGDPLERARRELTPQPAPPQKETQKPAEPSKPAEPPKIVEKPRPQTAPPATRRSDDIVMEPPPDFAGSWKCTITNTEGATAEAMHSIYRDKTGTYQLMMPKIDAQFPARYVDGNRIGFVIGDGTTDKDIFLDFEVHGNIAEGTDRIQHYDGRAYTHSIRCQKIGKSGERK